jgi:putative transposase
MAIFHENWEAPGPKGPSKELIAAVLEIKRLNPPFGCPRIARQLSLAFGLEIDKDIVCRILSSRPLSNSGGKGPSWVSIIAEARDSLWSADLFRCDRPAEETPATAAKGKPHNGSRI